MKLSKEGQVEDRMSLGFRKIYREVKLPDGGIIFEYDPHATMDEALEKMGRDLRTPTAEFLNFVINT